MKTGARRLTVGIAGVTAAVALSGCGLFSNGVYNTPLPGGADIGSHPLKLSADFSDALDLVPQSSVKVDDVAVGRVTAITLGPDEKSAHVSFLIDGDVQLPVGTTARLRTTSLLGEKYVALVPPGGDTGTGTSATPAVDVRAEQPLPDGSHLPLSSTSAAVDVEQVLGALSLVLNGGGPPPGWRRCDRAPPRGPGGREGLG